MIANPELMLAIGYCGLIAFLGWTISYAIEVIDICIDEEFRR